MFEQFESFLKSKGLVCRLRTEPDEAHFGNQLIEYISADIGVRMVFDRSQWLVSIADKAILPDKWYDMPLIRRLLGDQEEKRMPVLEKIEFIKANWSTIINCFAPDQRAETHKRLQILAQSRAECRWPTLKQVSDSNKKSMG